jgi:hypothetical protein
MKKFIVVLFCAVALGFATDASAQTFDFSDIKFWIGTGTNQAAFVIDWNDGITPESLVWGYRWNGSATGLQMIQAIDAADSRLSVFYTFGTFVYGIGYDLTGQGGTFTPGTPGPTTENGTAPFSGDHYKEGVYTGFWGYDVGTGNPYDGGSWSASGTGASSRQLTDGAWDGWSFSLDETNFTVPNPKFPTAVLPVPEPSSICLLSLGAAAFVAYRRRVRKP